MKKILISTGVVLLSLQAAFAQVSYLEAVRVENRRVEKQGKEVAVSLDLNLDDLKLDRQHSLTLVPVLVSADGSEETGLSPVVVNGKVRHKVAERLIALGDAEQGNSLCMVRKNGEAQTLHYAASVPFRRWMLDGRLELRAKTTGCARCEEGRETVNTGTVLPFVAPQYVSGEVLQPAEEQVKPRSEVRTARLQYRRDVDAVQPDYRDNRKELDKVQASIDAVKQNPNLSITGIYVTGYASPEGSMAYNLALSERRAKGFTQYMQRSNRELDKALWHVDWKGEDWAGFAREVEHRRDLEQQAGMLKLIEECGGDQDACEARVKALISAGAYQRLLNEVYVPLRRNEYRIEYNVRHFTLEDTKELLATRPDLLSVAEIQKVADSYGRNTPEYIAALEVAVETYPDNVVARHNCALAKLETEDYSGAIALLQGSEDGGLLNMLGVACAKAERYDLAREAFGQAVRAGSTAAGDNLRQMEEMLELIN